MAILETPAPAVDSCDCRYGMAIDQLCPVCAAYMRAQPKCPDCGDITSHRGAYCDGCAIDVAESRGIYGSRQTQIFVRGTEILR